MGFILSLPLLVNSKVKKIITIDSYTNKDYLLKNTRLKALKSLGFNKSHFLVSYLLNTDFISALVYLSKNVYQEEIDALLEAKAYEELGLDELRGYVISWIEIPHKGEERAFQIFVAEPEKVDSLFLSVMNKTKFIDLIIPAPLSYRTLYHRGIIKKNSVDCFIYFMERDAFITIYRDGEFLYSKSIAYSIYQLYEKYINLIASPIEENIFFNILINEGLNSKNDMHKQNFMKLFSEVFMHINDILIYIKRAFNIDNIDEIYLATNKGSIPGLDVYMQSYFGIKTSDLYLTDKNNVNKVHIDPIQYLLILSASDYFEDNTQQGNMSIYPRAPSFFNRAGGQFIVSIFAAATVGLIYPMVYYIGANANTVKIEALENKNKELEEESNRYKTILEDKRNQVMLLDKQTSVAEKTYTNKTKTLESIYEKKVDYTLKSEIFYTISNIFVNHDIEIKSMQSNKKNIFITLMSKEDRNLTQMLQYLSDKYFNVIETIEMDNITKNSSDNYYYAVLRLGIK